MKRKNTLYFVFFLLFFVSFFSKPLAIVNYIFMCVITLIALMDGSWQQKKQLLNDRKHIRLMLAFIAMLIISLLLSSNKTDGIQSLVRRIPLVLFPIGLGLVSFSRVYRDKILLGLAIIVSLACLFSLILSIHRYTINNDSAFLYNDSLSFFIGQQSIYTSVFVNISIYIFMYFILYYPAIGVYKPFLIAGIFFLFVISYLLASRNMMLLLYLSVFTFSVYIIIKRKKYLTGLSLLAGVAISILVIILFFPKTINRFKELAFTQFSFDHQGPESHYNMKVTSDQWNGANFRLAAWQCGWEVFKKNRVIGTGLGDKKDELFKVYEEKKFHFAIDTRKNVHNNYLDILMSMGIIGLLIFLGGWIVMPFLRLLSDQDGLGILILLTLALAMLTENYFDRRLGVMLFASLVTFLLTSSTRKKI